MSDIKTLIVAGGEIHDYEACGQAMRDILDSDSRFDVDYVENDLSIFADGLESYDVLALYYTLGELTTDQKNGLLEWVADDNGFVGVHSATDSFKECPEYRAMIGGHFVTHPHYREYQVMVSDTEHPITENLSDDEPVEFTVTDEMYVTDYDPRNNVLARALWEDGTVPVAWTKNWGDGRVYWLALGHDGPSCENPMFKKLLVNGTEWAAGKSE